MKTDVVIKNFFDKEIFGQSDLRECDLGWSDMLIQDAQSDDPETIFRYVVEIVGYNILFYWLEDKHFYTIVTERLPIQVKQLDANPQWDGKYEYNKAGIGGPNTESPGEVIAEFDSSIDLWDQLMIDGQVIGNVLKNSYIMSLD